MLTFVYRRLILTLTALLMVAALCASALTPAASAAVVYDQGTTISGTVVATPQMSLPATLLLQVGGQTIAVTITSSTQLVRQYGGPSNLAEFADGDMVNVAGTPNQSGGITASTITNTSVQWAYTGLKGTVVSVTPQGVVPATVVVDNLTALSGAQAPYPTPLPAQMNLPVTAATKMTVDGTTGPASSLIGRLQVNNQVTAEGVYDRVANHFDAITSLVVMSPPPPTTLDVTATLGAAPGQLIAPTILCLQNAQVKSAVAAPNARVASPCPAGELPVYVTASTVLVRLYGAPATLVDLSAGDALHVVGSLVNTQFTASRIQDTSIQIAYTSLLGTVQSVAANGNVTAIGVAVTKTDGAHAPFVAGANLALPLANITSPNCTAPSQQQYPCTRVTANGATTNGYTTGQISAGQTVRANGVFNTHLGHFLYIAAISVVGTPPPAKLTIRGILAASPAQLTAPVTLCLRQAVVSNAAMAPNAGTTSPCPAGELAVYVTSTTKIVRRYNGASGLDELGMGDNLTVTGSLINTQFTASRIQDTSIQAAYTRLVGVVGFVNPSSQQPYFTVRVTRDLTARAPFSPGKVLTVYVEPKTQIVTAASATNGMTALASGQMVTVLGVYNRHNHSFIDTFRVRIH